MSGHSKWSTIKREKGVKDAARGAVFTKLGNMIAMAARGGTDPEMNFSLRLAMDKAKAANMPAANIQRAIDRVKDKNAAQLQEVLYEGYGPGGVGVIIKVTTDNKQRAAQDVRSALTRLGGNLASTGAVSFQFLHAGQFLIAKEKATEDKIMELALEVGADDVITTEEGYEVRCDVHAFDKVAYALEKAGIKADSSEIAYIPKNTVPVTDINVAQALAKLHELLDEYDDVQAVFSNEEIDDATSAAAQG